MKVRDLIELLLAVNPDAEVIVNRECLNYGFENIDKILTGVFERTDYGNDFAPDQALIVNPAQIKAVCIYPKDEIPRPSAQVRFQ